MRSINFNPADVCVKHSEAAFTIIKRLTSPTKEMTAMSNGVFYRALELECEAVMGLGSRASRVVPLFIHSPFE